MADSGTRSITILKDNEKLFVLSESALKRLSKSAEQKENDYEIVKKQPVVVQAPSEEIEKMNRELTELRERNDLLWKVANGKLLTDVQKVQQTQLKFKHEKICQDCESNLNDCYMRNSSKPLLCSQLAKDFWKCVNSKKEISN